jgi:hypothetical protein
MLYCLFADGTVINERPARYRVLSAIDRNGRVDKVPIGVAVARAKLCDLAGRARNHVLMALSTGGGIEERAQAGASLTWIVLALKLGLIERERVARGFRRAVTDALRSWVIGESRSVETSRRFLESLRREQRNAHKNDRTREESERFSIHRIASTEQNSIRTGKIPAKL